MDRMSESKRVEVMSKSCRSRAKSSRSTLAFDAFDAFGVFAFDAFGVFALALFLASFGDCGLSSLVFPAFASAFALNLTFAVACASASAVAFSTVQLLQTSKNQLRVNPIFHRMSYVQLRILLRHLRSRSIHSILWVKSQKPSSKIRVGVWSDKFAGM